MHKFKYFLLRLLSITLIAISFSPQEASCSTDTLNEKAPFIIRPGFHSTQDRNQGYTDFFVPINQDGQQILFLNPKVVVSDSDENEENLGLGYRRLALNDSAILGTNFFYDTRLSAHGNRFQQVGLGAEWLAQWIDLRTNGYFSMSNEKAVGDTASAYFFSGTSVVRSDSQVFEEPLSGLDYEAGLLIPGISDVVETRVFGGGYHYFSDLSKDIHGFRGRVEVHPNRQLTLQFEVKDDNSIDTDYFVGGYFSIPLDSDKSPMQWFKELFRVGDEPRSLRERMSQMIVRDIDIVSTTATVKQAQSTVVNHVIHVNNTNSSGIENGSVDHPYNTLAEGLAATTANVGDWVFVSAGDGTVTGLTGNYVLANEVVLWGAGYQAFPGLGGGSAPLVDAGGAGAAITLAEDNTVQGIHAQNSQYGVQGDGELGHAIVRNNTIDTFVAGSASIGIDLIATGAATQTFTVANNTVSGISSGGGLGFGMRLRSEDTTTVNATVTGNTVNDISSDFQSDGINVSAADASTMNFSMSRNRVISADQGAGQHAGVFINLPGGATMNADLGGGSLGAVGQNTFLGNTTDIRSSGPTVKAENNYFGGGPGVLVGGVIDATPALSNDPN